MPVIGAVVGGAVSVDASNVTGLAAAVDARIAVTPGPATLPIVAKANNFTVSSAEAASHYEVNKATGVTCTVPTNTADPIPVGTPYDGHAEGAGAVTIAPQDGTVIIRSAGGLLTTRAQYSSFQLLKLAANRWLLTGDLA